MKTLKPVGSTAKKLVENLLENYMKLDVESIDAAVILRQAIVSYVELLSASEKNNIFKQVARFKHTSEETHLSALCVELYPEMQKFAVGLSAKKFGVELPEEVLSLTMGFAR